MKIGESRKKGKVGVVDMLRGLERGPAKGDGEGTGGRIDGRAKSARKGPKRERQNSNGQERLVQSSAEERTRVQRSNLRG